MLKRLLPMAGHTRGNRSAVTCELKCGNACSHPIPNTSANETFHSVAERAISRRAALGVGGGLAAAVVIGANVAHAPEALADNGLRPAGGGKLDFTAIQPVQRTVDTMTVPEGYDWGTIIRWGDPLFADSEEFDIEHQTGASAAGQFGYNNDYLNIISDGGNHRRGYLVSNHEYTNENIMFSPEYIASNPEDVVNAGIESHGLSVVELERRKAGAKWEYVRGGRRNRRITGTTPFRVTGPAAGHDLLKTVEDPTGTRVLGTLNNCSGGTTPWGTVLSGEENFNQYFKGRGTAEEKRYGISTSATQRGWERFHDRFDLAKAGYENEAHRFGWVVEIDPEDPTSTPVKHTLLGRFKHEAGTAIISESGHAVVYSGDDERHDYLYKFVSSKKVIEGNKKHNMTLMDEGTLYVAKFTGDSPASEIDGKGTLPSDGAFDGSGEWIALASHKKSYVPGMSLAEVLVFTRIAADKMGATKMDRPEDVETNPVNGKVYAALTNNTKRTAVDETNPVIGNRDGHVLEITEKCGDHTSTSFNWVILLLAGDPKVSSSAYFAGYPKELVSPISCPDNVAFDSEGNLWISTDGQPGTIGYADALHKVTLDGPERGRVQQFLAVPRDAETCGPVIHDRDNSVFVNVQHPGEDGNWGAHTSYFPDFLSPNGPVQVGDKVAAPRPSVVQVFNATGNNGIGKGSGNKKGNHGKGRGNSAFGHAQGHGPKK
ncbi:PhoX family phosphatase [Micrococcus sp. ACRRV]|uniref:PhoX family protein n=1 Tax=Micrococcus sp. ACRRV TaxID=2918203 RepID=UPI001EF348CB|nr:PhoX family phosphatase [Micrococcus sp. ACRRV]MCG7422914.1 PhoX family phosphatase [Micrococcus sp. ACRRV]